MAHTENLSKDILASVANQIGSSMSSFTGPKLLSATSIELTENFSVWSLGADSVCASAQTKTDLQQLAMPTGRWHHQVKFDGAAEAFARSTPLGADPNSWSLREFFVSPIAEKIDKTVDWVDQNTSDDFLVRLLIVPAYQIHAFWLTEDGEANSYVVIVDAPVQYETIQPFHLYKSQEFLDNLLREQHIVGIYEDGTS